MGIESGPDKLYNALPRYFNLQPQNVELAYKKN